MNTGFFVGTGIGHNNPPKDNFDYTPNNGGNNDGPKLPAPPIDPAWLGDDPTWFGDTATSKSIDFQAPNTWIGAEPADVANSIPNTWQASPTNKGDGIRYLNPNKPGETVIIEKGWPNISDPLHQGPYARISKNGTVERIPLKGNPTLNK